MTIPLQSGLIYGPVNSRRLGRSLGVNIVSTKIKTCTLNCVYCQYGLRRLSDEELNNIQWYPPKRKITEKLEKVLPHLTPPPSFLTFSGNGEATLHPEFPEIVEAVLEIRNKFVPETSVTILSNSSTVGKPRIRKTLALLDKRIMKLDCGNEENFHRYNQPIMSVNFDDILQGLEKMEDVTIQALFAGGNGGNYNQENIEDWLTKIEKISPSDVQIYSLDRPYPSKLISPLNTEQLIEICNRVTAMGISAHVY